MHKTNEIGAFISLADVDCSARCLTHFRNIHLDIVACRCPNQVPLHGLASTIGSYFDLVRYTYHKIRDRADKAFVDWRNYVEGKK